MGDHLWFRSALLSAFKNSRDYECVGEAGCIQAAIGVIREPLPDIVLLNLYSPASQALPEGALPPPPSLAHLAVKDDEARKHGKKFDIDSGYLAKSTSRGCAPSEASRSAFRCAISDRLQTPLGDIFLTTYRPSGLTNYSVLYEEAAS